MTTQSSSPAVSAWSISLCLVVVSAHTCGTNLSRQLIAALYCCSKFAMVHLVTPLTPIPRNPSWPCSEQVAARGIGLDRAHRRVPRPGRRPAQEHTYASGMYSGKRHRCSFSVQVFASWRGRLILIYSRRTLEAEGDSVHRGVIILNRLRSTSAGSGRRTRSPATTTRD